MPRSLLADPRYRDLSKLQTDVLLDLLSWRNRDGLAWRAMSRISNDLNLKSPGRVSEAIGALADAGFVTITRIKVGKPPRQAFLYRFDSSTHPERSSAPENRNGRAPSIVPDPGGRSFRIQGVDRSTELEPISRGIKREGQREGLSLPDQGTKSREKGIEDQASGENTPEAEADFESWWGEYPERGQTGQAAARVAYAKAIQKPGVTALILLEAAFDYALAVAAWPDDGHHPYSPANFLDGEHWNDARSAWPRKEPNQRTFRA